MLASDFYEEFKDALKYLGLKWGEMDLAQVSVINDKFIMSYGTKVVVFGVKGLT